MNSEQDAGPDLPEKAVGDLTAESDHAETVDTDTSPLQRAQDAIDEGWDAAREALKDTLPDDEDTNSTQSEQDTGSEARESPDPRPT